MSHTKTPWRHFPYAGSDFGICRDDGAGMDIAIVRSDGDKPDANAEHIVRCVNSHEALKAACEAIVKLMDGQGRENMPMVAAQARAALASCA